MVAMVTMSTTQSVLCTVTIVTAQQAEKMSARRRDRAAEEKQEVLLEEEERSVEEEEEDEDFEEAMKEAASSSVPKRRPGAPKPQIILNIPEAVDDFLRNFLRRCGCSRTLDRFETEWYGSAQKQLIETLKVDPTRIFFIPDALTHRQLLHTELQTVRTETHLLRQKVLAAGESLVRLQRERHFHRLQYRRTAEEKNRLIEDFKHLKKHLESYEPAMKQLDDKCKAALRYKMLLSLEKDRIQNPESRSSPEKPRNQSERSGRKSADASAAGSSGQKDSEFPVYTRPPQVISHTHRSPTSFSLFCSIKAHELPVSYIQLHPRKLIIASTSDDRSWRLWALPTRGEKVEFTDQVYGCVIFKIGMLQKKVE